MYVVIYICRYIVIYVHCVPSILGKQYSRTGLFEKPGWCVSVATARTLVNVKARGALSRLLLKHPRRGMFVR